MCLKNQSSGSQEVLVSMVVLMSSDSGVREPDQGQIPAPPLPDRMSLDKPPSSTKISQG